MEQDEDGAVAVGRAADAGDVRGLVAAEWRWSGSISSAARRHTCCTSSTTSPIWLPVPASARRTRRPSVDGASRRRAEGAGGRSTTVNEATADADDAEDVARGARHLGDGRRPQDLGDVRDLDGVALLGAEAEGEVTRCAQHSPRHKRRAARLSGPGLEHRRHGLGPPQDGGGWRRDRSRRSPRGSAPRWTAGPLR